MIGERNLTESFYTLIKEKKSLGLVIDGFKVNPISLRYQTFYQKGLVCPICGKKAAYFSLCHCAKTPEDRRHFNLFAEDGTMFTKDHINPKAKGGKDHISNLQTMCVNCNFEKGDG